MAFAALLVATSACAGGRDDDVDGLRAAAAELLDAFHVAVERQPVTQRSKDVVYVVADGTAVGDLAAVVDAVVAALRADGWVVTATEPLDPSPGSRPSHRVVATREDVVVQVVVAATLGTTPAPAGAQWVQLAVAHPDDRLSWTTTP